MKRFLLTTATALVMGTSAYGAAHTGAFSDLTFDAERNLNASELIGMRVYATEESIEDGMSVAEGGETEWDDIGEINEIVLTRDGDVEAVIIGVGGFLGMGERDAAVSMDQIRFVAEDGEGDDFFLVVNASAAGVQADDTDMAESDEEAMPDATEEETVPMTENRPMLTRPMAEREGFTEAPRDELTAEDLTGTSVYGSDDEDVGEIHSLIVSEDGQIERAVLDIGGFLGLGEHRIAVTLDELQIVRSDEDGTLRVYIDSTSSRSESALTTEAPTPCRPPDAAYDPPPNLPPPRPGNRSRNIAPRCGRCRRICPTGSG